MCRGPYKEMSIALVKNTSGCDVVKRYVRKTIALFWKIRVTNAEYELEKPVE